MARSRLTAAQIAALNRCDPNTIADALLDFRLRADGHSGMTVFRALRRRQTIPT
jgi:hypothetical protein